MSSYFCEEINRLDSKGRVCLPAILRQQLPERSRDMVYAYLDVKEVRILLFDAVFMEGLMDRMGRDEDEGDLSSIEVTTVDEARALAKLREERREQKREIYSAVSSGFLTRVSYLKLDDAGRMSLTPRMRKHASLGKDIYFCGLGKAIGVYDPGYFEKHYLDNKGLGDKARGAVESLMRGLP